MKKFILFTMLALVSFIATSQVSNVCVRANEVKYKENGNVEFFGYVYDNEQIKELNSILKRCDAEFQKIVSGDYYQLEKGFTVGNTIYHNFYFYYIVDLNKRRYYSHIAIWDKGMKVFYGVIFRELDLKYETNKLPYSNITDLERKRYLSETKKLEKHGKRN